MSTPQSKSSSSQSTSSTTTNQQVAADSNGIAIGAGASYVNEFSPDVASTIQQAINGVFNFAGNLTASNNQVAAAALSQANSAEQAANSTVSQVDNNSQLGQTSILTNPVVVFGVVAVIGIFAFILINKRG